MSAIMVQNDEHAASSGPFIVSANLSGNSAKRAENHKWGIMNGWSFGPLEVGI